MRIEHSGSRVVGVACLLLASSFVARSSAAPLAWNQIVELSPPPGGSEGERFGESVGLDGDTLIVGAIGAIGASTVNQGAAYIFRNVNGWTLLKRVQGTLGIANQNYGRSVAVSGSEVVVGAPEDLVGALRPGAVYAYERNGLDFAALPTITASDGASKDQFGESVAISGDTVVVGAPKASVGGAAAQGAAYVFVRSGAGYVLQKKLVAADGVAFDQFAGQVSISGNTVLVGNQPFGSNRGGAAYVFERTGSTWDTGQRVTPSTIDGGAFFGAAVAISGDQAVVTAFLGVHAGERNAYLFVRGASGWVEKTRLTPPAADPDDFGASAALTDGIAFIAALQPTSGTTVSRGALHVFEQSGDAWSEGPLVTASDGKFQDAFGLSTAASGRTLVVGAPFRALEDGHEQGAVYVFRESVPGDLDAGDGRDAGRTTLDAGHHGRSDAGITSEDAGSPDADGSGGAGGNTTSNGGAAVSSSGGNHAGVADAAVDTATDDIVKRASDDSSCSCRLEATNADRTNKSGLVMAAFLVGSALTFRRGGRDAGRPFLEGDLPILEQGRPR